MNLPDLPLRLATGLLMAGVAALALWAGGMVWSVFVLAIGVGVLFEWRVLVLLGWSGAMARRLWTAAGAVYCGIAAAVLMVVRDMGSAGPHAILLVLLAVIATDVGAYFAGRAIGGPRIAPRISPSKTWAGLVGGMLTAAIAVGVVLRASAAWGAEGINGPLFMGWGAGIAIIAQAGDFFESWMKRRAGVKDSGNLLPGHGGLFDRLDGLLAVLFVLGIALAAAEAGVRV